MQTERLRIIVFIIDENDTSDYTQIAPLRVKVTFFLLVDERNRDKSNIW